MSQETFSTLTHNKLFGSIFAVSLFFASCTTERLTPGLPSSSTPEQSISPTETKSPMPIVASPETPKSGTCPPQRLENVPIEEDFVGLQIPPYPDRYDLISGLLVDDNYVISHVKIDEEQFIWLEFIQCLNIDGKSCSQVVDAVTLSGLQENEFIYSGSCSYEGIDDLAIVALGYFYESNSSLLIATKAWRANTEKKLFEQLPAEKVRCVKDCEGC